MSQTVVLQEAGPVSASSNTLGMGRIGPNAILQVTAALAEQVDQAEIAALFEAAGLRAHLDQPPTTMVDEREVVRLHQVLRRHYPGTDGLNLLKRAGALTADYILAHRIPKLAQTILRLLPARLAAPALLAAISQHAWTFAGSGQFTYAAGHPTEITLTDCPACLEVYAAHEPSTYFEATFEGLFRALVHPKTQAQPDPMPQKGQTNPDGRTRRFHLSW